MIFKKIASHGGRVYLVGGYVRDLFLGLNPINRDFLVTGLSEDQFKSLFPEAKPGNNTSRFRLGNKAFKVLSNPGITIEEYLGSRDLTIDAIALDMEGRINDPFRGLDDLDSCTIRAVSPSFSGVYRAARFSTKYEFPIEKGTLHLMRELKDEIHTLPVERVYDELKKALSCDRPSLFFRSLKSAGVLDVHFPELADLVGVPQPPNHHPEGCAFEHTMQSVDAAAKITDDLSIRWAALVHDLGKGVTPVNILPKHHGHEKAGVPLVNNLGKRLKLPEKWTYCGMTAAALHMKGFRWKEMRVGKLVTLLEDLNQSSLGIEGLAIIMMADHRGRDNPTQEVPEVDLFLKLGQSLEFDDDSRLFQDRVQWVKNFKDEQLL